MVSSFINENIDYNVLANPACSLNCHSTVCDCQSGCQGPSWNFPERLKRGGKQGDPHSNSWKNSIMTTLLLMPTQFIFSTCNETLYHYKKDKKHKSNIGIIMINLFSCFVILQIIFLALFTDLDIYDRFVELPLFYINKLVILNIKSNDCFIAINSLFPPNHSIDERHYRKLWDGSCWRQLFLENFFFLKIKIRSHPFKE